MPSMTDIPARIKESLIKKAEELCDFIEQAIHEGASAHEVEENLWSKILDMGHHAMGAFLKGSGDGDAGESVILPDGQSVKRLKCKKTKKYLTIFGQFEIQRVVYGTREGQKIQYIPLDTRLNLPESKFSCLLQDWDQSLATEMPFNKVNSTISRILGFEQSVNSLERTNRKMSESVDEFWSEVETPSAEEEGSILVTTADGKGVVMRNSEVKKSSKKPDGRPGNKKMSLVGAVYTVDPYVRRPKDVLGALFHDLQDANKLAIRPKPCHKRVNAALLRNEKGKTDPQSAEIFGWMANEAQQRNPDGQKPHILIMDGQESQWNMGVKLLPEDQFKITEILDLIHVTSYVWDATHLFFPKKSQKAEKYARKQIERILNNGVNGVIDSLRRKGRYENLSTRSLRELEKTCGYFVNNAHRMMYKDYLEQGFPIASGVIEGACRNVVKDRMEHSGMRWVMKGAHAMLSLRSIQLSGLWDAFTQFRINREKLHLYTHEAANDASMSLSMIA